MIFEVVTAENGKEGLYIYKQEQPDLVITDLIMPDKEGLETIRELKQMNPSAKIIAISGGGISSPTAYLDLAQKMGAAATFEKPLDNEALLSMVKKLIDLSG